MTLPTAQLSPGTLIPRLISGGWQFSDGHTVPGSQGRAAFWDRATRLETLRQLVDAGATAFDCADIYTGVEELLGELLRGLEPDLRRRVRVHTKFVPDLSALPTLDRSYVESIIDRSLKRLGVETLDLVQYHWWDYSEPELVERMVDTGHWLDELRRQGKIRQLGVTNFDAHHLGELLAPGIEIVSAQVQYSLLDRRPAGALQELCDEHGVVMLCYGSLAGGFLTDAWLNQPEPGLSELENRSLHKYLLIIEEFGGWALFQKLLQQLSEIAQKHNLERAPADGELTLQNVALRWLLDQPKVAAAIVGQRRPERLVENSRVFSFQLDDEDQRLIDYLLGQASGPSGAVYELERDREGRHGSIMKYDLNHPA